MTGPTACAGSGEEPVAVTTVTTDKATAAAVDADVVKKVLREDSDATVAWQTVVGVAFRWLVPVESVVCTGGSTSTKPRAEDRQITRRYEAAPNRSILRD